MERPPRKSGRDRRTDTIYLVSTFGLIGKLYQVPCLVFRIWVTYSSRVVASRSILGFFRETAESIFHRMVAAWDFVDVFR